MLSITILAVFLGLSFLVYGASCLVSQRMRTEFVRFGLARYRVLTGWLEILGAVGVLVGLADPRIGFLAAAGLTVLMVGAVGVRLRLRDGFGLTLPSLLYLLLTLALALLFLRIE